MQTLDLPYRLILGSGSPRRRELLRQLRLDFEVRTLPVDETLPDYISTYEAARYLAREKSNIQQLAEDELLITADTIVIFEDHILGKPSSEEMAKAMLRTLSGQTHQVVTGVCLRCQERELSFRSQTDVQFKVLSEEMIDFYVKTYRPYDKAGAYGIQEWMGMVAAKKITGDYYNVVGLPVGKVYEYLLFFV